MMRPCLFVINILMLKTMVRAEVDVTDGQAWTHKDIAFNGAAAIKDVQTRHVISPRMDFEQWTPLGRGDPLKNDPTFDYLPPVLDKVHYWKSPSAAVRAAHPSSSTVASVVPPPPHTYNRRFFLTDYSSKKEPAYVQYVQQQQQQQQQLVRKRPVTQATAAGHLHVLQHYPTMPKVPLPMLTPPPLYQRPASQAYVTAASDVPSSSSPSSPSFASDAGDSAAESKQPPAVRAPPPVQLLRLQQTAAAAAVRPASHSAVIKVLLENEVDRTTVTTAATTVAAAGGARTQPPPPPPPPPTPSPATDDPPPFAHYRQPAVQATGRPMYLIIQGHSKVKTYGLVNKSDDLTSTAAQPAVHEHNHIGSGPAPDEPSRRKRDGTRPSGGAAAR